MTDFDPSPRISKRRRTGTYATRRTTLNTLDIKAPTATEGSGKATEQAEDEQALTLNDKAGDVAQALLPDSRRTSGTRKIASTRVELADGRIATADKARRPRSSTTKSDELSGRQSVESTQAQGDEQVNDRDEESQQKEENELQLRSSGRTRRAPRRFSPEPQVPEKSSQSQPKPSQKQVQKTKTAESITDGVKSPQPKGILTPSRRGTEKRGGPRKSVVFDADERQIEEQLGFKDIDSTIKTKSKRTSNGARAQALPQKHITPKSTAIKSRLESSPPDEVDGSDLEASDLDGAPDVDEVLSLNTSQTKPSSYAEENEHITRIKSVILSRMTNQSLSPLSHLSVQFATLHSLLSATVTAGESNSLLLLGSRGSGKSALVAHALEDVSKAHSDAFHVVRLNGFVQTDDKLALREIWRQLGREMAVSEDETGEVSSYADTMASLLSLLSHPEELADPDAMVLDDDENRTAKSVVFILDEFDLFTTHPRQTLLYNLFDIAQAKKAPIAVIGCSTRMDIVDCLEKRVKSRFSHRWLHVPTAKSLPAFEEAVTNILVMSVDGREALGLSKDELLWRDRWNLVIQTQFLPSSTIQSLLKKTFYGTKSIPDVLAALYIPVATLSVPSSDDDHGKEDPSAMPRMPLASLSLPSLLTLLPQLPLLHLSLLISAARLEIIYNFTAMNLALAYSHYTELLTRSKLQRSSLSSLMKGGSLTGAGLRQWNKNTARGAWEELAKWEIIVPVSGLGVGGSSRVGDEGLGGDGVGTRMFRVDVTLDEVSWAVKEKIGGTGAGEVLTKWCHEV